MITQILRTILVIVIAYYVIRFITRYVVPVFTGNKRSDRNVNSHEQQHAANQSGHTAKTRERSKKIPKDEGDYVDYEEVK
jgi:hypothetical protein